MKVGGNGRETVLKRLFDGRGLEEITSQQPKKVKVMIRIHLENPSTKFRQAQQSRDMRQPTSSISSIASSTLLVTMELDPFIRSTARRLEMVTLAAALYSSTILVLATRVSCTVSEEMELKGKQIQEKDVKM